MTTFYLDGKPILGAECDNRLPETIDLNEYYKGNGEKVTIENLTTKFRDGWQGVIGLISVLLICAGNGELKWYDENLRDMWGKHQKSHFDDKRNKYE